MQELTHALRTAVANALHDPTSDDHASSDPSNISSLSGSLPSDRRKLWSHITSVKSIAEARRHLMEAAHCVEGAVGDIEAGIFHCYDGADAQGVEVDANDGDQDGALIDLLVSILTLVPSTLLQRQHKLECMGDTTVEERHHYLSSIEHVCFSAASISADVILKYVVGNDDVQFLGSLGENHVDQMMEHLLSLCDTMCTHDMGGTILLPIVRILNALTENRHMERILFDNTIYVGDFEYDSPPSLFHISAKDTLRLIRALSKRVVFESTPNSLDVSASLRVEMTSHVGLFTAYLLDHFADVALAEIGHTSFKECPSLFVLWANGANEHMARRLNDDDAMDVCELISRLQIESIQSALEMVERAESIVSTFISDEANQDKEGSIEGCVAAVHDCLRTVTMAVISTETIEKLGLESDPEVHVIFHPLIVAFASFTAAGTREAVLLSRRTLVGQEGEGLTHLADDLLLRICGTTIGMDFLQHCDNGKRDEVLTIALLRALDSSCVSGKGKFLLDIASHLAQPAGEDQSHPELQAKRRCYSHIDRQPPSFMDSSHGKNFENRTTYQREMVDVLIMCMTMSQSSHHESVDMSSVGQTSCIASSLMMTGQDNRHHTIDPLNPWHSLNIDSLKEFVCKLENSPSASDEELGIDVIRSYSASVPFCLETEAANLGI
ncbi:hypothetical protein ACHAWX_001921 [Stephanocyclus meneghinianus]